MTHFTQWDICKSKFYSIKNQVLSLGIVFIVKLFKVLYSLCSLLIYLLKILWNVNSKIFRCRLSHQYFFDLVDNVSTSVSQRGIQNLVKHLRWSVFQKNPFFSLKESILNLSHAVKSTVISPNFLVRKFCGKAQFPHSFGWIARNSAETVPFHKIPTPEMRWNYGIFHSDRVLNKPLHLNNILTRIHKKTQYKLVPFSLFSS